MPEPNRDSSKDRKKKNIRRKAKSEATAAFHPVDVEEQESQGRQAAHEILCYGPNQAFLNWQESLKQFKQLPSMGRANNIALRAEIDTLREWFEDLGHWHDLDPHYKDDGLSSPSDLAKKRRMIQVFIERHEKNANTNIKNSEVNIQTTFRRGALIKKVTGLKNTISENDFQASMSFRRITWKGSTYSLSENAAKIIGILYYIHREYRWDSYAADDILEELFGRDRSKWRSKDTRIKNYFRKYDAGRIWKDKFIDHDGNGNFFLNIDLRRI